MHFDEKEEGKNAAQNCASHLGEADVSLMSGFREPEALAFAVARTRSQQQENGETRGNVLLGARARLLISLPGPFEQPTSAATRGARAERLSAPTQMPLPFTARGCFRSFDAALRTSREARMCMKIRRAAKHAVQAIFAH